MAVPASYIWQNPFNPRYVDFRAFLNPIDNNPSEEYREYLVGQIDAIAAGESTDFPLASQYKVSALAEMYDQMVHHHKHWHRISQQLNRPTHDPSALYAEKFYNSDATVAMFARNFNHIAHALRFFGKKGDHAAARSAEEALKSCNTVDLADMRKALSMIAYASHNKAAWVRDSHINSFVAAIDALMPHYNDILLAASHRTDFGKILKITDMLEHLSPDKYQLISNDPKNPSDKKLKSILEKYGLYRPLRVEQGISESAIDMHKGSKASKAYGIATLGELDSLWEDYVSEKKGAAHTPAQKQAYDRAKSLSSPDALSREIKSGNDYAAHAAFYDVLRHADEIRETTESLVSKGSMTTQDTDKMAVHMLMSKFAADVVPKIMEQTKGDLEAATRRMTLILTEISNTGFAGLEKLKSLNTGPVNDWSKSGIRVGRLQYKVDTLEKQLDESKKMLEKSNKTILLQDQALKKASSELGRAKEANQSFVQAIQFSEKHGEKILSDIQAQAAKISYAACADHLRQKLISEGESIDILDDFPTMEEVTKEIRRELREDSLPINKSMLEEYDFSKPFHPLSDMESLAKRVILRKTEADKLTASFESGRQPEAAEKNQENKVEVQPEKPHGSLGM